MTVSELRQPSAPRSPLGGAEVDHYSPGVAGIGLSTSADHALGHDEVFSIDYGCILDGYFSDAGLTIALGDLPEPLRARYDALAPQSSTSGSRRCDRVSRHRASTTP